MSGAAIAIIRGCGVAGIDYRGTRCHTAAAVDAGTVWEAASLSKPVFAAFVAALGARDELDLDAPLEPDLIALRAVPDPRWQELTARHCAHAHIGLAQLAQHGRSAARLGVGRRRRR